MSAYYTSAFANAVGNMLLRLIERDGRQNDGKRDLDGESGEVPSHHYNLRSRETGRQSKTLAGIVEFGDPTPVAADSDHEDEAEALESLDERARPASAEPLATAPSELEQVRH
eukprot:3911405-Heterocapsa_arctica.AAC.1